MVLRLASILAEGESKLEVSDACVRFTKRHQTRESVRAEFREPAYLAPVDGDRWRSALGKRLSGERLAVNFKR
ncbi:hypothetical protein AKJ62_03610 [candidate division MSBL1 archaeon SCGC-AAA259D14]|uniref:Uncharacterized protein n=1 Tax=candidate division MSBL1 archaeon SCGC-AAA259D14 TaxID=1698261 RepID=A0A133U4R5_9EURY|nr:hypothetical protein AKJ62_03610 [candidate division MSBL1 archaeon SCGC-AAA259D14]